jgi:integrase
VLAFATVREHEPHCANIRRDVSVYTLMKLLGHESMTTSQRYVSAAGAETRRAAA